MTVDSASTAGRHRLACRTDTAPAAPSAVDPASAATAQSNRRMLIDSISIVGTSGLTAVVGLIFWTVAAHVIPARELGVDTAVISLITTAATVAAIGVSNAFGAILPVSGSARRARLRDGYLTVLALSAVSGVIVGVVAARTLSVAGSLPAIVLMVAGATIVWSFFIVQDQALTGCGKAVWLPPENLTVSIIRLGALLLFAGQVAHAAVAATIFPSLLAVVVVSFFLVPYLSRNPVAQAAGVEVPSSRRLLGFAGRDGAASSMSLGLMLAMPFIVTSIAGPVQGATFALALAVSQGLDIVTSGAGVSLTVHASRHPERARSIAMGVWKKCFPIVAFGAAVLICASPFVLSVFGPSYSHAHGAFVLSGLALSAVVRTVFVIWASLQRAYMQTGRLLRLNAVFAVVTLPVVIVMTKAMGNVGTVIAILAGSTGLSAYAGIDILRERKWQG